MFIHFFSPLNLRLGVLIGKKRNDFFVQKTIACANPSVHVYRIRVRGRCLRGEQTSRESQ